MKIVQWKVLLDRPVIGFAGVKTRILGDVERAIACVCWPEGATTFTIFPQSGKKRGEGNGVVPIKEAFIHHLTQSGWVPEHPFPLRETARHPGKLDAALDLPGLPPFAAEWETGNISSSHRALNKMLLGMLNGLLCGGVLVLPTRRLYVYLTDRVGNFEELSPYFPLWSAFPADGYLAVIAVEHDAESDRVPRISKGTDGRALA